jgi:uncharacterized protein (DUF1697 family)
VTATSVAQVLTPRSQPLGAAGQPVYPAAVDTTWLALLRGINVGGRNRILMADLRTCFEDSGYTGVRTFIQSGNVVFDTARSEREAVRSSVERMLAEAFDYDATVELRDVAALQAVVASAPPGFGDDADTLHYDVLFLLHPLQPEEALEALTLREGIDAAWTGPDVVYVSRVRAMAAKSGLSRIASHPSYQRITIRNWNTTTRLLALMEEGPQAEGPVR